MPATQLVHTVADLRAAVDAGRGSLALVPTMGNLHAGHLSLVKVARELAERTVASIFVNPLQFGPGEDYDSYPRTLEQDVDRLAAAGVDLVFAPGVADMYPLGHAETRVALDDLASDLCGAYRPGHFTGVTTVVSMLFNQVRPDIAVFGEKDYQQLALIRRMVADLHFPVAIRSVPTARADDGLALSSRNQYLDHDERRRAPALYATLQELGTRLRAGERDFAALAARGQALLREAGFEPEYVTVRAPDLQPPDAGADEFVILAAAHLGRARLIDNLRIDADLR